MADFVFIVNKITGCIMCTYFVVRGNLGSLIQNLPTRYLMEVAVQLQKIISNRYLFLFHLESNLFRPMSAIMPHCTTNLRRALRSDLLCGP
jgi:hypothetical protein